MTGVDPIVLPPGNESGSVPPRRRWLPRLLGWALVAATLGFLGLTIARHRDELAALQWRIEPLPLAASLALLALTLGWGVWIWQRVLLRLGERVPLRPLLRIWFLASLARYVPGKVWQFVGAVQLGRGYGIAALPIVTSMVVSMGFTMAAALLIGAPLLAFQFLDDGGAVALSIACAVLVLSAVHPAPMNAALRLIPRTLHRDVLRWTGGWADGLLLLFWSVLSWVAYGCAFSLFAASIFDVAASAVPAFIAANAIAVLAGIVAVVAPAGLGVREYTMNVLLEPWLPAAGAAALLAVLSRLWVVAGELLGAGLSVLVARDRTPGRNGTV